MQAEVQLVLASSCIVGGSDFVSGVVDVVFPAGTQNRSCADVPIIDDSEALEGVESFQVVIIPPDVPGVVVDGNPIATVEITDDDGMPHSSNVHSDPLQYLCVTNIALPQR